MNTTETARVLWDGKNGKDGNIVPDGTYYYQISFRINIDTERERSYQKKGYILLSTSEGSIE